MMKRDRVIKLGVAVISVAAMFIGGSIAYFRAETRSDNQITSTALKIALMEGNTDSGFNALTDGHLTFANASPGKMIDRELFVQNVEETTSYVRVTLTKYWQDANGNKLPEKDASHIKLMTSDTANWFVQDQDRNSEVVYMYYKLPLAKGEATDAFLNHLQIAETGASLDNSYTDLSAKVDVEVDAIQTLAAKNAILSEWGLEVEFDSAGAIVTVEE